MASVAGPLATATEKVSLRAWLGLAALAILSIYSVIDRQIFILLAEPIKLDMKLSDTQLGLLQGVGLALVGTVTIYPISWLADRYDRRLVVAGCVTVWSAAVVLCGLAPDFFWLMAGASLVGIGEAGIAPAGFAMIPDLFPESRRQTANSAFAVFGRFGGALGVVLAGYMASSGDSIRPWLPAGLAELHNWRLGFFVAVVFAPVAVLLALTLPRSAAGPAVARRCAAVPAADAAKVWPYLKANRHLQGGFFLAMGVAVFALTGVATFVPVIAARDFGQTPVDAGKWLGAIGVVSGIIGFAAGIALLKWLTPRAGTAAHMQILAGVCLAAGLASLPLALAGNVTQLYLAWGFQVTVLTLIAMVMPTALQNMTPAPLRARLFALIATFQLVAAGLAPVAVGALSDVLAGSIARSLVAAVVTVAVLLTPLGAWLFWRLVPAYVALVDTERHPA